MIWHRGQAKRTEIGEGRDGINNVFDVVSYRAGHLCPTAIPSLTETDQHLAMADQSLNRPSTPGHGARKEIFRETLEALLSDMGTMVREKSPI